MATGSMKEQIRNVLFTQGAPASTDATVLEQYKLCVEMVDKISERRQHANTFFLGINTALCALVGYIYSKDAGPQLRPLVWSVPLAGACLSYFWYRLVRSYRDLNGAKFEVIQTIEEKLPLSPYRAEWVALGEGKDPKRYLPFTHMEIWVPRCFIVMYVGLFFFLVCAARNPAVDSDNKLPTPSSAKTP